MKKFVKKLEGKVKSSFKPDRLPAQFSSGAESSGTPPVIGTSTGPMTAAISSHLALQPILLASTPAQGNLVSIPYLARPPTPNVQSEFDQPQLRKGVSAAAETGWKGLRLTLDVLEGASTIFPPLQTAVRGLKEIIRVADQVYGNQLGFKTMIEQITRLSQVLQQYKAPLPKDIGYTLDALAQSIERRKKFIEERMNKSVINRVLNVSKDAEDIVNSLREMAFAVELFQIRTTINIEVQGRQTLQFLGSMEERELLKILNSVDEARYDIRSRNGCMDGTRLDTLSRLLAWAADPDGHRIFWLSGMAGIGKTAIAVSFCQKINDDRLGASFFCSRQAENLSNVSRIIPTIVYQLAYRSQTYRVALIEVLRQTSRRSYSLATLQEQVEHLLIALRGALDAEPLVVVIDAVDECTGFSAVGDLLRVILRSDLPLKFLITSRPETYITNGFSAQKTFRFDRTLERTGRFLPELSGHESLRLHDIENDIAEEDITRYLTGELSPILEEIVQEHARHKITELAKRSGNLFIFAFTAVMYLDNDRLSQEDILNRLSILLSGTKQSRLSTETIDNLYVQIFKSAHSGKEESEVEGLRAVLGALLCLRVPQSIATIAVLLQKSSTSTRAYLENFSSVLNIHHSDDEPVLTFHASFPDYVLDQTRSGSYAIDASTGHQRMASMCLNIMNNLLHEDLCNIGRRQTSNADISVSVIDVLISPALRYACVYWASHLTAGASAATSDDVSISISLVEFVNNHLLHWLECLSLIQELRVAYDCVEKARLYVSCHAPKGVGFVESQSILLDAQNMIPQIHYFIKLYALEVYVSALVWLPSGTKLKAKYARSGIPRVVLGLKTQWDTCLQALYSSDQVECVAFMPSGTNVACGAGMCIQIWACETGELVKELLGHTGSVMSVGFSADGSKLVSGSWDCTIIIWNVDTGELINELLGHTAGVNSVTFSVDGFKIASGSYDRAVRIWNVDTGELIEELVGHLDGVTSVVFSADGSKFASGSQDGTVRIWNANTNELIKELLGHITHAISVTLSANGSKLASGSWDKTVRIWNADTGELIKELYSHTDRVVSVAFSADGSKLASGSLDETVRIWNPDTGELIKELLDHMASVTSVVFSADGSRLASGSQDETVRIWNADTASGKHVEELLSHTDLVCSVAFSADGSKLTSGLQDGTVRIWNADTGELTKELFGHTNSVTSVAFSADASKLASGSLDMSAKIWNVDTGELLKELWGTIGVSSVGFSIDGSKLASLSRDYSVIIWNVNTGELIEELLGYIDGVNSVAFSTSKSELASGSKDNLDDTVWMWNADTSQLIDMTQKEHNTLIGFGEIDFTPKWSLYLKAVGQYCIFKEHYWLWIWGFSHNVSVSTFSDHKACIGYESGHVVILDLASE